MNQFPEPKTTFLKSAPRLIQLQKEQAGMSSAQPQAEAVSLKFRLVCIYNYQFSDWALLLKFEHFFKDFVSRSSSNGGRLHFKPFFVFGLVP
jgi:hypothetical protein